MTVSSYAKDGPGSVNSLPGFGSGEIRTAGAVRTIPWTIAAIEHMKICAGRRLEKSKREPDLTRWKATPTCQYRVFVWFHLWVCVRHRLSAFAFTQPDGKRERNPDLLMPEGGFVFLRETVESLKVFTVLRDEGSFVQQFALVFQPRPFDKLVDIRKELPFRLVPALSYGHSSISAALGASTHTLLKTHINGLASSWEVAFWSSWPLPSTLATSVKLPLRRLLREVVEPASSRSFGFSNSPPPMLSFWSGGVVVEKRGQQVARLSLHAAADQKKRGKSTRRAVGASSAPQ